ncbi:hypothetical protein OHA70_36200 [Kribbella sp. NBC_00382]|uniref:hypothetical protein n=1 Tax=Kribbella sp. NBC_00382 TaxID=2975967 RepID=UPI002E1A4F01
MRWLRTVLAVVPALALAGAGLSHPHFLTLESAASWQHLHLLLLPVFPLLAVGFLLPLWRRPGIDVAGFATVTAWVGAFVYATFYTGLDLVAGLAAGTVARNTHSAADLGAAVQPLFEVGDRLGHIGVYGFAIAAAAMSVVLFLRHGVAALAVAVVLLSASYSFLDSHIFSPRGVYTMVAFAAGFGLAAWISAPTANSMPRATTTTGQKGEPTCG